MAAHCRLNWGGLSWRTPIFPSCFPTREIGFSSWRCRILSLLAGRVTMTNSSSWHHDSREHFASPSGSRIAPLTANALLPQSNAQTEPRRKLRVLLVEDHTDTWQVLAMLLRSLGCVVVLPVSPLN